MDTQTVLIDCLKAMHLKIEDAEIVISLLRTKNQMEEMLYWIKDNHERKPNRIEIIREAIAIEEEITD